MSFVLFRHKSNGVVESLPEHYATHPTLGADLELYVPEEYEEDKVVDDNHGIPLEQRISYVATPVEVTEPVTDTEVNEVI